MPAERPSPEQIAALVEELVGLGVSRRRIAQALDVNPSTLHRQGTGAVPPSWVMVRALERECEIARAARARMVPAVVVPVWTGAPATDAIAPARGLPVTIDLAEPGKDWAIVEVEIASRSCGLHAGERALVELGGDYVTGDVLLAGVLGGVPELRRLEDPGGRGRLLVDDRAAYPLDAQSEIVGVVRHALRVTSRRV